MVGIMRAGAAYVPLDPKQPRIDYLVTQCKCRVVAAQKKFATLLKDFPQRGVINDLIVIENVIFNTTAVNAPNVMFNTTAGRLAYVLFTSGSTGKPKGVLVPHSALLSFVDHTNRQLQLDTMDRVLSSTTFTFDASVQLVWCPLVAGSALVLARHNAVLHPQYVHTLLASHRISFWDTVPSLLVIHLDATGCALPPSLKHLFVLGEECQGVLAARALSVHPSLKFTNRYAPQRPQLPLMGFTAATIRSSFLGPSQSARQYQI